MATDVQPLAPVGKHPGTLVPRLAWDVWLARLQWLVAAACLAICCRGSRDQFWWFLTAWTLPLLSLLFSGAYRQAISGGVRWLWASLEAFASDQGEVPWAATAAFVVVPSAALFLSNNQANHRGDTWPVLPTACNVVTRGSGEIGDLVGTAPAQYCDPTGAHLPYCVEQRGGGVYSRYPAGMVFFAVPVAAVARLCGADLRDRQVQGRLEKWAAAWLAACSLGLFFLIGLHGARPWPCWLGTGFLATGSVMFSTCGQSLWQQGGVIFWSLTILLIELRRPARPVPAGLVGQALACGMMLACRLSSVTFLIPFGVWVLYRAPYRAVCLAFLACIAYAPWAIFYWVVYGTPLGPSVTQMDSNCWFGDMDARILGVLVSPARGVLVYQPWLLLALVSGWFLVFRRRGATGDRPALCGLMLFALAAVVLHLGLVTLWKNWWGGHCWGSRLAGEIVPLWALLCLRPIACLWRRPATRWVLGALALSSFLLHAVAVYGAADYWSALPDVNTHTERLQSWSAAPFLYPLQHRREG